MQLQLSRKNHDFGKLEKKISLLRQILSSPKNALSLATYNLQIYFFSVASSCELMRFFFFYYEYLRVVTSCCKFLFSVASSCELLRAFFFSCD